MFYFILNWQIKIEILKAHFAKFAVLSKDNCEKLSNFIQLLQFPIKFTQPIKFNYRKEKLIPSKLIVSLVTEIICKINLSSRWKPEPISPWNQSGSEADVYNTKFQLILPQKYNGKIDTKKKKEISAILHKPLNQNREDPYFTAIKRTENRAKLRHSTSFNDQILHRVEIGDKIWSIENQSLAAPERDPISFLFQKE